MAKVKNETDFVDVEETDTTSEKVRASFMPKAIKIVVVLLLLVVVVGLGVNAYLKAPLPNPGVPDKVMPIPVLDWSELSYERFYQEHQKTDIPLVVKGVPPEQSPCFGGLGAFNDSMFEDCSGEVTVGRRADSTWYRKGTQPMGKVEWKTFLKLFRTKNGFEEYFGAPGPFFATSYGSLRSQCPNLWRHYRFPPYSTGQIRIHAKPGEIWSGDWMNVYFAKAGYNMSWHADVPSSEIWTTLCTGRKHYRVVGRSHAADLIGWDKRWDKTLFMRPDEWPLGMPVWEGTVVPGMIAWLPAGSVHAVDSIEDSINILDDCVDMNNLVGPGWVQKKLFEARPDNFKEELEWIRDSRLQNVYDGNGQIQDPKTIPTSFATWAQLDEWGMHNY